MVSVTIGHYDERCGRQPHEEDHGRSEIYGDRGFKGASWIRPSKPGCADLWL